MKEKVKDQSKTTGSYDSDSNLTPISLTLFDKETLVVPMRAEEKSLILKDLLGNFSDQTGASFG
jgi:hypothetical protein